jgi:2,3-bisphosphoglycerate-dependent phosphoglycerate mutase
VDSRQQLLAIFTVVSSQPEGRHHPLFFGHINGTISQLSQRDCPNQGSIMSNYLVLLRHGESQWNLENRFTGFHDVDLTEKGISEAKSAGKRLKAAGIKFDKVFSSTQKRANHTAELALTEAGQPELFSDMARSPDLRERDYGDLTGLNKDETREKYGDEQVHIWRRSYDVPPPGGECLQDVVEKRVRPYYEAEIKPLLESGENVLVAAHGNSLRALLIIIGAETPESINAAEMPTGVPLVFELDDSGKILSRQFLETE